MSELKVSVVSIDDVQPHPNADRLDLAVVAGWNCVVRKGEYVKGDKVVYIPIDAVLPPELEGKLFPIDSKVKLKNSRIRTIKLRGAISQGLVVRLDEVGLNDRVAVGTDVREDLGITKYEPPASSVPSHMQGAAKGPKKGNNPHFKKYTDIENFKWYKDLFAPGEPVYVSEKLHGTSARFGWFPEEPNTVWKKVKALFRKILKLETPYEFCIGSRNVQLQGKKYNGFYEENVYAKIAKQYDLENRLMYGEAVYGEIVGEAIQKGYTYGCGQGEHRFYVYDAQVDGAWLGYHSFIALVDLELGLDRVPELYVGPFDAEKIDQLRKGDSTIGGQKVREGVVIKAIDETNSMIGRKVLKYINDDYLLREDNTDFH